MHDQEIIKKKKNWIRKFESGTKKPKRKRGKRRTDLNHTKHWTPGLINHIEANGTTPKPAIRKVKINEINEIKVKKKLDESKSKSNIHTAHQCWDEKFCSWSQSTVICMGIDQGVQREPSKRHPRKVLK